MSRTLAILPAAGLGTRMGADTPKQFLDLDGVPLIVFTLRRLALCPSIDEFIIATRADEVAALQDRVALARLGKPARVVHGGETRQESVANALAQSAPDVEIVVVHDAVRPFVTVELAERVITEARARGAAILGIPAIDTVKEVKRTSLPQDMALITATIPRERIVLAQTPQAFSAALLRRAFALAQSDGFTASDEAALVERLGRDVFVVLGSERNLKITRPADMDLARFYLQQERPAQSARDDCSERQRRKA
jgi:2-C-methyl-D-erythritol 4-phosphate cytidylyltransferase